MTSISEQLQKTRNPHQIAEATGAEVREVRKQMTEDLQDLPGWGPVRKQRHIVSRRRVFDDWPAKDSKALMDAKRLHDQGRVSMAQGRDGDCIIQYAFPTSRPLSRRPYFYEE